MRVSKADGSQVLDLQRDALIGGGVSSDHLYEDHASGKRDDRPGLDACLKSLRKSDTLVAWKFDRIGRDLRHLVNLVHDLTKRGVGLRVLAGEGAAIDTTTPNGRLMFGFFAALAEFDENLPSSAPRLAWRQRALGAARAADHSKVHRQAAPCPGRHGSARYQDRGAVHRAWRQPADAVSPHEPHGTAEAGRREAARSEKGGR